MKIGKDLIRRLERQEERLGPKREYQIVWVAPIDPERRRALAPGERIVEGQYGTCPPSVVPVIEQSPPNPNDRGHMYPDSMPKTDDRD